MIAFCEPWLMSIVSPAPLMTGVETVPVSTTKPVGNTCAPALAASASRTAVVSGRSRSEEHTSELQSLMRISYAVFCLKKKKHKLDDKCIILQNYRELIYTRHNLSRQ